MGSTVIVELSKSFSQKRDLYVKKLKTARERKKRKKMPKILLPFFRLQSNYTFLI